MFMGLQIATDRRRQRRSQRCGTRYVLVCHLDLIMPCVMHSRSHPYSREQRSSTEINNHSGWMRSSTAIPVDDPGSSRISQGSDKDQNTVEPAVTANRYARDLLRTSSAGAAPPTSGSKIPDDRRRSNELPSNPVPTAMYIPGAVSSLCNDMLLVLQQAGESDASQLDPEISREANLLLARLLSGGISAATNYFTDTA